MELEEGKYNRDVNSRTTENFLLNLNSHFSLIKDMFHFSLIKDMFHFSLIKDMFHFSLIKRHIPSKTEALATRTLYSRDTSARVTVTHSMLLMTNSMLLITHSILIMTYSILLMTHSMLLSSFSIEVQVY